MGMEEEEEDRLLLNSLGVTSAKTEEVERGILTEIEHENEGINDAEERFGDQSFEEHDCNGPSMATQAKFSSQLRAVEVEIKAVAESIKQARLAAHEESNGEEDGEKHGKETIRFSHNGLKLQHALATDRLKSLKRTKVQLEKELNKLGKNISADRSNSDKQLKNLVKEDQKQKKKLKEVQSFCNVSKKRLKTVAFDDDVDFDAVLDASSAGFMESERDKMVRKGILTPFHKLKGFERPLQQPGSSTRQTAPEEESADNLASASISKAAQSFSEIAQARPTTKLLDAEAMPKLEAPTRPFRRIKAPLTFPRSSGSEVSDRQKKGGNKRKRPLPDKVWRRKVSRDDDFGGNGENVVSPDYDHDNQVNDGDYHDNDSSYVTLEGELRVPDSIFSRLFDYQKVGLQWLWELHCQRAGGIIGDEMGLGKTIQVLSFLGSLHFSKMYKPSIVICPVTLLRQWKREAQKWYPGFHVEILHDSAQSPSDGKKQVKSVDSDSEGSWDSDSEGISSVRPTKRWDTLIDRVLRSESGLLITSYEQLRILAEKLLDVEWGYAILDEGHRIRNPNAEVTLVCKQLQTVHRIIMTGAPIQNKLSELWSLFDFVFPGKLGVLPVFESEFSVPITVGGYTNATPLQVSTAYRCAVVLRDLIMPYLLRRMKVDVNAQLPKKTEHVLFCRLTAEQRTSYRAFLASSEVEQIFDGSRNSLYGIDVMRKICNHPDLLEREYSANNPDYGNIERSGKMKVVAQVLKLWKEQGHRVLLFAQTQQMLDIVEIFLTKVGYTYRRMDGLTPVKQRMSLMDEFNNSTEVFVFILTTKVGGLGTNLTGANRVIVYDPDWNPSTDMQARERAWRIGQTRDVTVYRLITRGTIEEKVYHRQVYKHFLTNKILKNPQQRRFFKARDMKDLFALQDDEEGGTTETSNIFGQVSGDANVGIENNGQGRHGSSVGVDTNNALLVENTDSSELGDATNERKEPDDQSCSEDEETRVLKSLFGAQGLHSAMNHDIIMNADDGEKMRLEEEASKVAQRAAEALRQSRMLRRQDSVSIPTWTGKAGTAGAPSSVRKKFGSTVNSQLLNNSKPSVGSTVSSQQVTSNNLSVGTSSGKALSSAQLLARIRGTQERAVADGIDHQFELALGSRDTAQSSRTSRSSMAPPKYVQPEILIRQLCTFMQIQGGSTSSAIIVQYFKEKIPPKNLPLFKNLLKELATLVTDENGASKWVLKPEYNQ